MLHAKSSQGDYKFSKIVQIYRETVSGDISSCVPDALIRWKSAELVVTHCGGGGSCGFQQQHVLSVLCLLAPVPRAHHHLHHHYTHQCARSIRHTPPQRMCVLHVCVWLSSARDRSLTRNMTDKEEGSGLSCLNVPDWKRRVRGELELISCTTTTTIII